MFCDGGGVECGTGEDCVSYLQPEMMGSRKRLALASTGPDGPLIVVR